MSASGDIGKFLAQTRTGKYLKSTTRKVTGLVDRVAKLRVAVAEPPVTEICPTCGTGRLRVISVKREPMMGELGPQELTIRCDESDCGHSETRMHGYSVPIGKRGTD